MSPATATKQQPPAPSKAAELIREIELYLRAVDEFRRQSCPPAWRPEP